MPGCSGVACKSAVLLYLSEVVADAVEEPVVPVVGLKTGLSFSSEVDDSLLTTFNRTRRVSDNRRSRSGLAGIVSLWEPPEVHEQEILAKRQSSCNYLLLPL